MSFKYLFILLFEGVVHDVAGDIPAHRKSYAEIVKSGISYRANLGPPVQMSGET